MIGILGGIGSGKSSIARGASDTYVRVVDADRIGHALLDVSDVRQQLVGEFGDRILNETGGIDRRELAEIVFGTGVQHEEALGRLERILHPRIGQEIRHQIDAAGRDIEFILLDAAVLLEAGWEEMCDALIFVDTPHAMRIARVSATRGWDESELTRREAAQWPLTEKRRRASLIVENSTTLNEASRQLRDWLRTRRHPTPATS